MAREAALAFKVWAVQQRLFNAQLGPEDSQGSERLVRELEAAFVIEAQDVKKAVQARRVTLIAYNEAEQQVLVYLNKSFTKKVEEQLPQEIGNVKIVYLQGVVGQIGPIPSGFPPSPGYVDALGRYCCGSSIFPGGRSGAGTLGALLAVQGCEGKLFGLSNNHVVGQCNYSDLDHPIVAPGSIDVRAGFIDPFTVGHFARSCSMHFGTPDNVPAGENLDASIFSVRATNLMSSMQGDFFDTPRDVGSLADNMLVKKVGRTTGLTHGRVSGKLAGAIPVQISVPDLNLHSQVYFENAWVVEGLAGEFSSGGDSGSLVVTEDSSSAVGLLFAGDGSITLVLPLEDVLSQFKATLISGL